MNNWFNSAFKAVNETATNIGKNIGDTTSNLLTTVQEWLPFSDEETLAFFAVLFAVAAADGEIGEDELSMILSSPEVERLSAEGKKKLQSYSCDPPALEESIAKLSQAHPELKFGLIFYILNLIWIDGVMTTGETEAIKIAQKELEINDVQVQVIKDFIDIVAKAQKDSNQEIREEIKDAIERMKKVGIPIASLAHSQHEISDLEYSPENLEYSDEKFLQKIQDFGLQAGKQLVEKSFILWYVFQDPNIPTQHKLIIGSALAYLIFPIDMIPDILPVVGFSDDLPVIAAALTGVAMSVTPEIEAKAKKSTDALFSTGKVSLEGETIDVDGKELE